jgi:hypothetical protein
MGKLVKNKYGADIDVDTHCPDCEDRLNCPKQPFGNCFCLNCFGFGQPECCEEVCPMLDHED